MALNRLSNVPLSYNNYIKELKTIKYIAVSNDNSTRSIDKLLCKRIKSKFLNSITSPRVPEIKKKNWLVFYFNGSSSQLIGKPCQKKIENSKIVFRQGNTINSNLCSNKDKIDILDRSGVYKLTCDTYQAIYIFRTNW